MPPRPPPPPVPPPAATEVHVAASPFLVVLCQSGAAAAVKLEAAAAGLKLAFSRPGFLTFKVERPLGLEANLERGFPSVFARHVGISGGSFQGAAALAEVAAAVTASGAVRLHVAGTDDSDEGGARETALRAQLWQLTGKGVQRSQDPQPSDVVATVTPIDETFWLSFHRAPGRTPWPGGRPRLVVPDHAPSRAWLKAEEAIRRFQLPVRAGQRALEIGSAPGGATQALLDRGLDVVGIDPNLMDPRVLANAHFTHVRAVSTTVDHRRVPGPFQWIFLDVNVPPGTALRGALPFVEENARQLQGIVFTLKLKSWEIVDEISGWLHRIQRAAPHLTLSVCQLYGNGQEICVVGRVSEQSRETAQH